LKVQIGACLEWKGPAKPISGLVHIHGDKDRLMPIASIKEAKVVKGGGHFMVFANAKEVQDLLVEALQG
jgi:hypothetical protein